MLLFSALGYSAYFYPPFPCAMTRLQGVPGPLSLCMVGKWRANMHFTWSVGLVLSDPQGTDGRCQPCVMTSSGRSSPRRLQRGSN